MKIIEGGITAAQGFLAAGISSGIKTNQEPGGQAAKDLAVIYSQVLAATAATYTKNKFKAPPLQLSEQNLQDGRARAIVINSGCANACTGPRGYSDAQETAAFLAQELDLDKKDVLVASTGVIGVYLPMDKLKKGLTGIEAKLSRQGGREASLAIMTTDTVNKEYACQFELEEKTVRMGAMAKGSGMIHPDMATMLAFITTDAAVKKETLQSLLKEAVDESFNMISVDGDTSTNDMVCIMANGLAGNEPLDESSPDYEIFKEALFATCRQLALAIVRDGEGASKLVTIEVKNALTKEDARRAVRSISSSNLVKTALFGQDANWGRIITALGYSGAQVDPASCNIYLGDLQMAAMGQPLEFSEDEAQEILKEDELKIICDLGLGGEGARGWTCDLSYEYIKINADYRS